MSEEISEVVIIVVAGTFLMMLLAFFLISFFFIHQRRQQAHQLEKAALKAQYEQEILNAENEIQDSIMKHISRELHDNVGQMLTLVKIQLNNLSEESPTNKRINDSKDFVNHVLQDIRALSKSLNSDNILQEGIEKAISFELDRVRKLGNFEVKFSAKTNMASIDRKKDILIFRIFQELLQNCLKHAKAKNIIVNLEVNSHSLILQVIDDGIGFNPEDLSILKGFQSGGGLKNLKHRASLLSGDLSFSEGLVGGVNAQLTIPL